MVTILQNAENPETLELIAEAILNVSDAVKKIRAGRLTERALVLLIQDLSGVNQTNIMKVLKACEGLAAAYTKMPTGADPA